MREVQAQFARRPRRQRACARKATASSRRVRYAARRRDARRIPADLLLLHQGVVPNVNLAMAAGCRASLGRSATVLVARARRERQFVGRRHRDRRRRRRHRRRRKPPLSAAASPRARRSRRWRLAAAAQARADGDAARRSAKAERGRVFLDTLFRPAPQFRIPPGRHHRLPLRGGHGQGRSRCRRDRRDRPEPDQGLSPHRHGAVPGPALRPDRHRADGAGARQDAAGDRLLPAARAGQADHAGRACRRAEDAKPTSRPWCADDRNAWMRIVVGGGIHGCSTALHLCLARHEAVC